MRTLVMPVPTWLLMFHSVCGFLAQAGFTAGLTVGIGRCSLRYSSVSLRRFHECLCTGFQTCEILPNFGYLSAESHNHTIVGFRERTDGADSSTIHYVCDATCTSKRWYSKVGPLTCRRAKPDESENRCKEGPECNNIRFTEKSNCGRCIDIRWSKPDEIKVSTRRHDILQHGQCPRESTTTLRSSSVETSVDLSAIFSNGSALSNATTPSAVFPRTTFTEESENVSANGPDLHLVIIPLVLAISVIAIAATALCIIYRRRCKPVDTELYRDTYITPLDVTYSSSESLEPGRAGGSGLVSYEGLHSSAVDRSSHIYLAMENEYVDVSFPNSCSRGPVQTPDKNAGACMKTSANENAETEAVYADLGKTARTTEASSKAHYANMCSFLPNSSSTTATNSHKVTEEGFVKDNRLSQAFSDELNYSTINECAVRTDNTLKHFSPKCENASVCNDVEGAYKIMKATATHLSDNTKNSHDSRSSGTKLLNNMMYTRLRENPGLVSNVYDDLITESDDAKFKSALLSSSLDFEDEYISVLCPLHKKQCSEEDHINGNVYENHNSGLNVEGSYVNNAMVSKAMRLKGTYTNCAVDEDKTLEAGSPYVNYTDPEVEHAPSLSTCHTQDARTNKHLLANGYSTVRGCAGYNSGDVGSCDDIE